MKIALWNCNGGISKPDKCKFILDHDADLYVLPEVREKNFNIIKKTNPNLGDAIWKTNNFASRYGPKGLGVIGRQELSVSLHESYDPDMELFLPIVVNYKTNKIHLLAVWNFYHASKGRYKGKQGEESVEYAALKYYEDFLRVPYSLVVGDWNIGPTLSNSIKEAYLRIHHTLAEIQIQNLYHTFSNAKLGHEDPAAHHTYRSVRGGNTHTLDHIHASHNLKSVLSNFIAIPPLQTVRSDHGVIIVEFNMNLLAG